MLKRLPHDLPKITDNLDRALVIRCGAYGDMLICSPIFRALKKAGYKHVALHTGDRGMQLLGNHPCIDEFIIYPFEDRPNDRVDQDWLDVKDRYNPDYFLNLAESIEVNVSLHPRSPAYNGTKEQRALRGNRNFYEVTEELSGLKFESYRPDVIIRDWEINAVSKYLKADGFNILWNLSGSGANKAYPWTDYVMGEIIKNNPQAHFITVGNEKCQLLETLIDPEHVTNLAGKISFRETMVLCKAVNLVISPDSGVLHAAGAFDTPKIGILGHTTINNVTKHFINDHSLEANSDLCECSPCFRLIYDHKIQCPIDNLNGAAWCMSVGQKPGVLSERIQYVIDHSAALIA